MYPLNTILLKLIISLNLNVLLLFCSVFNIQANPQDYRYQKAFKVQRLSLSDGLSESTVRDVIQDSDGYIWLATEDGLNRFDSYDFKVFRHDHRNPKSLHENWTITLVEEPGYGIWVGTVAGLSFYDPKDDSFTDYSVDNKDLGSYILSFLYSQQGKLWIGTDNGLYYFDRVKNKVIPFISSLGNQIEDEISSIDESKKYIYIASSNCVYRIEKATNETRNLCDIDELKILNSLNLLVVRVLEETLWIGSTNGLFKFDNKNAKLTRFMHDELNENSISDNYIQDLAIDVNSGLWIATTEGLNFYNTEKEKFDHYQHSNIAEEGLSANDVYSLYIDNQDLIWVGTYGGGVNILDPNQHQFEHLLTKTDVSEIGGNNTIHGIEKDQYGSLWLATFGGGLINYDLMTGNITRPLNEKGIEYDKYSYALLIDKSDRIWVGALSEIKVIDLKSKSLIETRFNIDGMEGKSLSNINRIYEDHQGQIWVGSDSGLYKFDKIIEEKGKLKIFVNDLTHKLPQTFANYSSRISTIIDDRNGNFWIGGRAGLVFYDVKEDEMSHFYYDKNNAQSLSNNNVQVIHEDSQGFIWIGTADGLNRVHHSSIDRKTFYFDRITTYEGLPNNSIYGILEDEDHQLWISTNLGLVKYISNATNMDLFRQVDGLASDEFNTGAYFSDSEGRLFFGTINGITVVNTTTNVIKTEKKQLMITSAKVGERVLDSYKLNHSVNPNITQRSDEAAIDISVANINFDKLGTQRYRYRILGLDMKWKYLGIRRNIFVVGLPEGEYELDVQSQLAGQLWSSQIRKINIRVETNFWHSSQAYYLIGFGVFLLFLVSIIFNARHYRNKINITNKKMSLETLRLKELRTDNESLKNELEDKESEVITLNRKLDVGHRKLGIEKYRDVVTGFYRLNYLYQMNEGDLINLDEGDSNIGFSFYKTLVVIEIADYLRVHREYGPLAAAELTAKISVELRQKTDSDTQIFSIQNGMFLLLSGEEDKRTFKDRIVNLNHHIRRSEYEVANGLSTNANIALTISDIAESGVSSKTMLITLVNLLIQSHRYCSDRKDKTVRQINFNKSAAYFMQETTDWSLESLIRKKEIEFIEL